MKTKLLLSGMAAIAVAVTGICTYGLTAPINQNIPYAITMNRPELRPYRDILTKGNTWVLATTPAAAHLGMPCTGEDCAYGLQALSDQAKTGKPAFFHTYSQEQRDADPTLNDVGIFHLDGKSEEKKPYVVMIAGGGFTSVCTIWESLPVSAAFREMGYDCFCIQYRTGTEFGKIPPEEQLMGDVASCISYINDHAEQFGVLQEGYLIGGFSAGSMTVSMWANENSGWGKYNLPKPGAVCLIYGVIEKYTNDGYEVPTFCRYCLHDPYFTDNTLFTNLQDRLTEKGIPNDFKGVEAHHGFGLGTKSEAEGWTVEAEAFWHSQVTNEPTT